MGSDAGGTFTTGSNCTAVGHDAQPSSNTVSNEITLGDTNVTSFRIPGIDLEAESGVLNIKNGGTQSEVRWYCESSNAHYAAIKAPAHSDFSGNITFTLPATTGSNGQVLSTDGSGALSWVNQSSGGGGASAINDLSDAVTYDSGLSIGLGTGALANDDGTDNDNTALGYNALNANTSGHSNTAVGWEALHLVTTGHENTAVGFLAGQDQTTAVRSTFVGSGAGRNVTTGSRNTVIGDSSGSSLTTGASNVVIGQSAGSTLATGQNNIILGDAADVTAAGVNNEICIGGTTNTTFRLPGLQSGASNGDVLTYDSTNDKLVLSTPSGRRRWSICN